MVTGESPEWLPPGFVEKVKYKNGRKIKYFYNVATGAIYHSKKDVIHCATTENVSHGTPQTTNDDDNGPSSHDKFDAILSGTDDSPQGLPKGWKMQEKPRNNGGSTYKVYIDSSSGKKFYSRAAVERYLNSANHASTTTVKNKLDSVNEPFPDTSLQLSITGADSSSEKEKKESTLKLDDVNEPLRDMPKQLSMTSAGCGLQKKKKDSSFGPAATMSTPADGLPAGWIKEIRTSQSGNNIRKYPVYIDSSTGKKFMSRAAVDRYLNSVDKANATTVQNKLDNVEEAVPDMSLQLSTTVVGCIPGKEKEESSFKLDDVDEPLPDMPEQSSMTKAGHIPKKKMKESSFKMVSSVTTPADGLPPGWMKEIVTSQSGDRIRRDPFFTDPVSGYAFRSKPDALRFLKTNNIGNCACKPKRRDQLPVLNAAIEKITDEPQTKRQFFHEGEINGGGELSRTKLQAHSGDKKIQDHYESAYARITSGGADSLEEKKTDKNAENGSNFEPGIQVSKDVTINSPVTDPSTKKLQQNGMQKQKSKRKRELCTPSRASKRLSKSEPEMQVNSVVNEHALRSAARKSSDSLIDSIPPPSGIEPLKETVQDKGIETLKQEEAVQEKEIETLNQKDTVHEKEIETLDQKEAVQEKEIETLNQKDAVQEKEIETLDQKEVVQEKEIEILNSKETVQEKETETLNQSEPPPEDPVAIAEEQTTDGNSNRILHESQLSFEFGDSWSDPCLEFAYKTLTGEISLDDPLGFPGCFNDQLDIVYNNQFDGCLRASQSDVPGISKNENAPPDSSKQHRAVEQQLPPNPSLGQGNTSFTFYSSFNGQSSADVANKDFQTKYNP